MNNLEKITCILVLICLFVFLHKNNIFEFMTTEEKMSKGTEIYKKIYTDKSETGIWKYTKNLSAISNTIMRNGKYIISHDISLYHIIFNNIHNLNDLTINSSPSEIKIYTDINTNPIENNTKKIKGTHIYIFIYDKLC